MLENDLKDTSEQNLDPNDNFTNSLGTFCTTARTEYTQLLDMSNKMEALYSDVSEYFVFDKQKYSLDQFFGDIKQFKDQFKQLGLQIITTGKRRNGKERKSQKGPG